MAPSSGASDEEKSSDSDGYITPERRNRFRRERNVADHNKETLVEGDDLRNSWKQIMPK